MYDKSIERRTPDFYFEGKIFLRNEQVKEADVLMRALEMHRRYKLIFLGFLSGLSFCGAVWITAFQGLEVFLRAKGNLKRHSANAGPAMLAVSIASWVLVTLYSLMRK